MKTQKPDKAKAALRAILKACDAVRGPGGVNIGLVQKLCTKGLAQ